MANTLMDLEGKFMVYFTEWNPNPIIVLNLLNEIIYLNLAARTQFPSLSNLGTKHPILLSLPDQFKNLSKNSQELIVFYKKLFI